MNHDQLKMTTRNNTKWGAKEKAGWLAKQSVKRSYADEVLTKLKYLSEHFTLEQYGALSYAPERYPLYLLKTHNWDRQKKTVLITGGVHGYETSGVQGALRFLEKEALNFSERFNIIVAPCISPWGYETINRWNPNTVDPNRSFYQQSPCEESLALMKIIASLNIELTAHFDLHETTDSDNTEFRPALAARDAVEHTNWNIPDGFYLVGDIENPVPEFQHAMIKSVEKVTHIAPPDENGCLIGEAISQHGVINYAVKKLSLCTGFTHSQYSTTTEVYPDSPKVTDEDCINAQVAAVIGGLDYINNLNSG